MIHQIYLSDFAFNAIINGVTSMISRTFMLDPMIIADDYVILINRKNKKRTMVQVTDSEKKVRLHLTEMLQNIPKEKASIFKKMYENNEKNTRSQILYKIKFKHPTFHIEFPVEKESNRISEITFFVVSDDGITLNKFHDTYGFYKIKIGEKDNIEQVKADALKHYGLENEEIIPLMKYSVGKSYNESCGQILLIQPKVQPESENVKVFKPKGTYSLANNYESKILAETVIFDNEMDRYIFWVLEMLYREDNIPENELGLRDEPETIAEILCNRIMCLHDAVYVDYNNFIGDNFRIYVEPHLTNSQCFERTTRLALTEENYQQVMDELIYNPAFAEWALKYNQERTLNDRRYINEWLQ